MDNNSMMQQEEEMRRTELRTLNDEGELDKWQTQKLEMDDMNKEMSWNNYASVKMTTVERIENGIVQRIPQEIIPMRQAMVEEGWQTLYGDEKMSDKERKERLDRLDKQAKLGIRAKQLHYEKNELAVKKTGEVTDAYKATLPMEERSHFEIKRGLQRYLDLSGTEEAQQKNFTLIENMQSKDQTKRHAGYKTILDRFINLDMECFQPPINDDKKLLEFYEKYGQLLHQGSEMRPLLEAALNDGYEMSREQEINLNIVASMMETTFWMVEQRVRMIGNVYNAILSDKEKEELDSLLGKGGYELPSDHRWSDQAEHNPEFRAYLHARSNYLQKKDSKDIGYQLEKGLEKRLASEREGAVRMTRNRRMETQYPGFIEMEKKLKEVHPDITQDAVFHIWRGKQAKTNGSYVKGKFLNKLDKKFKGRPASINAVKKGFKFCRRDAFGRYATEKDMQMAQWNNAYAEAMLSDRVEDRLPFLVNIMDDMDAIQIPKLEEVFSKGMFQGDMDAIDRMYDNVEAFYYMQKSKTNTKLLKENMPEQYNRMQQLKVKLETMQYFFQWFDCVTRTMMSVTGGEGAHYEPAGKDSLLLQRQMAAEEAFIDCTYGVKGFAKLRKEAATMNRKDIQDRSILYAAYKKAHMDVPLEKTRKKKIEEKYKGNQQENLDRNVYGFLKECRAGADGKPLTDQDYENWKWNNGFVDAMLSENKSDRNPYLQDIIDEFIQTEIPDIALMKDDEWLLKHMPATLRLMGIGLRIDNLRKQDEDNREFFNKMPKEQYEAMIHKQKQLTEIAAWLELYLQSGGVTQHGEFADKKFMMQTAAAVEGVEQLALEAERQRKEEAAAKEREAAITNKAAALRQRMADDISSRKAVNVIAFTNQINGKLLTEEELTERVVERELKDEERSQAKKLVAAQKLRTEHVEEQLKPYAERDAQMPATGRMVRAVLEGNGSEEEQELLQKLYSEDQTKRYEVYESILNTVENMNPEYLKRSGDAEILKTYEVFREEISIGFVLEDFLTEIQQKDGFTIDPERLVKLKAMSKLLTVYHGYLSGRVNELGSDYYGLFTDEEAESLLGMTRQVRSESAE